MRNQFIFEPNSFASADDGNAAANDSQYIRRLQQALNRESGSQLPLDGAMNFRTRRAIRNFQRQKGLPADGIATPRTKNTLGLSDPILLESFPLSSSEVFGEREYEDYEAAACQPLALVAVENPGGKRIQNKKVPDSSDLVTIQGAFAKTRLHRLAAAALKALVCAARADGIKHPQLLPTGGRSGFRDPKFQKAAWERALKRYGSPKEANKWVAKPGFSAHQTGRAIDFYLGLTNDSRNVMRLRRTSAYKWMVGNAHRFGFYPYPDEPWHWEYNPPASIQSEFFPPMNESFDFESDFENEYESFEYDRFADETGDLEFEAALDVLSSSELKAVKITSTFETGRAGGFGGLTGNFDGQGISFGLLNFAFKAGSLPPLLKEFINKYPARYSAIFGKDAPRFKDIVFAVKPDPKNPKRQIRDLDRQMEFVNKQMNLIPGKAKRNKIVEPWKTYFDRLEKDSEFRKIQVKAVRRAVDRARHWFNYFGFKTERGFVFMFDLVSSHGGAWLDAPKFKGKRKALLQKMLAAKKTKLGRDALTELEKMEVIANMIADASLPEWREKARARKLWFVRGSGKVHGTFYDIRKKFGVTDNAPDFGYKTPPAGNASELEWERGYGSDERESEQYEQRVVAPAPPLLERPEKAPHGETFYVKIGLGRGLPASTGIYIPNSFKPSSDVAIAVYLHGHKGGYPGNAVLINGYWDAERFPFFGLREEVSASERNVIFVAPSLGSLSQAGSLIQKNGFDAYINQVLAALNEHFMMPRYSRRIENVKSIILSAHSGGGSPMLRIAKGTDRNVAKITEYWGFDSMYGAVASTWVEWAKSHPFQKLYVYYGPAKGQYDAKTGKKRVLPRDNAEAIACEIKRLRLTNVCVQPSRAKTIMTPLKQNSGSVAKPSRVKPVNAHFWVPKVHLKERLLNSPCPPGNVCPKR